MRRSNAVLGLLYLSLVASLSLFASSPTWEGTQSNPPVKPPQQTGATNQGSAQETPLLNPQQIEQKIFTENELGLTEEQMQRLREIRKQNNPTINRLGREVQSRREALNEAIFSDNFDEAAINARTAELAEAQAAQLRANTQASIAVRRLLTPEQVRQFREARAQHMEAQRLQRLERQQQNRALSPANQPNQQKKPNINPGNNKLTKPERKPELKDNS